MNLDTVLNFGLLIAWNLEQNEIGLANWIRFYFYCRRSFERIHNGRQYDVSFSFKCLSFMSLHFNLAYFILRDSLQCTIRGKNYGKNCYLGNFVFLPPSPLNNVEKQRAKLASSNVMGSQHCRGFATLQGGRRRFLNIIFKIHIIFCHWL